MLAVSVGVQHGISLAFPCSSVSRVGAFACGVIPVDTRVEETKFERPTGGRVVRARMRWKARERDGRVGKQLAERIRGSLLRR